MREMGDAVMGSGIATGENRAVEAAHGAISSPLLEDVTISGAQGGLVKIPGGPSMSLVEVDEATEVIHEAAGEDANVILGAVVDETMKEEMMVTVIATGFNRRVPIMTARGAKSIRIERIPTGAAELQKLEEPAFVRRGVDLTLPQFRTEQDPGQQRIDKADPDKPAFLRK